MIRVAGLVVVLLLGIAGCAGSLDPTRFYVLAPADPAVGGAVRPSSERDLRIGIRSVELPRYLERAQIVTRASANRLELAEFHQWGAPLRLTLPGVLAENLARLIPSEQVLVFPWGRTFEPDAQVRVEVSRLEGALGGESVLVARWRIVGRNGNEVDSGNSRFSEATGPDYESLVATHSRLLGALSQDIAEGLRRSVKEASAGETRPSR